MFNFNAENQENKKVPFFDDVRSADGWEGQTTSKTVDKLQSEIGTNLSLINCVMTGIVAGSFGDRPGYQIHFAMKSPDGKLIQSRMDIACLPINPKKRWNRRGGRGVADPRIEGTKKMALYMTAKAIKGMYFLSSLSPAFIPFMSMILTDKNTTLGQRWVQNGNLVALMPPKDESFSRSGSAKNDVSVVDGDVVE